ncbi:MAG TPA: NAD(P)-dependent oxidoreductase [Candidatus Deferrimicrobiaceae bacterium]|nr:NAD(P)-dependent oxidoreductase [Candidatus Deferrimicrobiaceae bacterium]
MAKIGFIGLGIMGAPMCRNLLAKGHDVTVYNRSREKMAPLVAAGAKDAASVAQLVGETDIVITMLSDPAAVWEVVAETAGVLSALTEGKTYIDMSTVSPESSREIAAMVRKTGADFLEAPVLGSRKPAVEGTLVILAGGDPKVAKNMEPILHAMGNKVFYMGEVGLAAHMKLIINQMMGTMLCVFSEAALTGMAGGIPPEKILEVIESSVVGCMAIRIKGKDMLGERKFPANFPLKHAHKDMRLAVLAGDAAGVPTPVTAAAYQLFSIARERGFGDRDVSAVLRGLTEK